MDVGIVGCINGCNCAVTALHFFPFEISLTFLHSIFADQDFLVLDKPDLLCAWSQGFQMSGESPRLSERLPTQGTPIRPLICKQWRRTQNRIVLISGTHVKVSSFQQCCVTPVHSPHQCADGCDVSTSLWYETKSHTGHRRSSSGHCEFSCESSRCLSMQGNRITE